MSEEMYTVQIGREVRQYEKGTTYRKIAEDFQKDYENDIVLVFIDEKLQELHKKLTKNCVMRFVTTGDEIGHKTYKRSMCFMLVKAIYDSAPKGAVSKVRIHYSVSKGYYCTVEGDVVLNQEFLNLVTARMEKMAEENMPIGKRSVHTDEAVALFKKYGMHDKEKLFNYRRVSRVNIYNMNEFEDYYYGYMVPSAGYLKYFYIML